MKVILILTACMLALGGSTAAQTTGAAPAAKSKIDIAKKIAEATPPALPQSPRTDRPRSDAQIANLKGKVKSVTMREVELENGKPSRTYTREESFDEAGDLLRTVDYDDGRPRAVTVYGYTDGQRVSRSGAVQYAEGENPSSAPTGLIAVAADDTAEGERARFDMRYVHRFDADGRLIEKLHFGGVGEVMIRVTYTYESRDRRLVKHFGAGPVEWGQTTEVLDAAGNVVEEWLYDEGKKVSEIRTSTYESDAQGNWIVQKTVEKRTVNGKPVLKPISVSYRTIVYRP